MITLPTKSPVQIVDYSHEVFTSLSDFQNAKNYSKISRDIIIQLGDIICKYKLHNKIGLCLLHKHFDINKNERLIRKVNNNIALTTPCFSSNKKMVCFMWKIEEGNNDQAKTIYPLEFIELSGDSKLEKKIAKINKIIYSKTGFLAEFSNSLIQLELTNAFGFSILNKCFLTKHNDETFLETTNEEIKLLNLKPAKRSLISQEMIQTQWSFEPHKQFNDTGCSHCSHCGHTNCGHCYHI